MLALYGQSLIANEATRTLAVRLYAAGIIAMILAWRGTYRNRSFLTSDSRAPSGVTGARHTLYRWLVVLAALGINVYSVARLRSGGYEDSAGAWGWAASLALLLVAFVGYRPHVPAGEADGSDVDERTDFRPSRRVELAIFLAIFALGLAFRLHRLGDWTTGMHGDEGEVGLDALKILEGNHVSPFLSGWFGQPNFYYWSVALGMKAFGTGLAGLRAFSALSGALMILPFYFLVRRWFGVRTAIVASVLLAISDVTVHFSRQEFSNITTPLLLVTGFLFFFRGLSDGRTLNFVLAGYAHMFSMYFYLGGRLTPILLAAFLIYLFGLMPVVRALDSYREIRRSVPGVTRRQAASRAFGRETDRLLPYLKSHVPVYVLSCFCFAAPWLVYYADNRELWSARVREKLIFNQPERMRTQYGATHDPLYVGLAVPKTDDALPFPVTFTKSPASVKLAQDGFWPRVVWRQVQTTLSILTHRFDASSVYTFTGEPVAKPTEAALIILGIAWALWRWRDTRMALLSIWFWSTVLVGGALTIDAPYMARLIGIVPVLALFAAIPVSRLAAAAADFVATRVPPPFGKRLGEAVSATALLGLLAFLTWQNYTDYFRRYLALRPFQEATGQALFVRQVREQALAERRPPPKFYSLGAHHVYWGYGVNRFLNYGTPGQDMANPSNELPVVDDGRDVVFMVWPVNKQYLPVIKAYYPEGVETPFHYGPPDSTSPLFLSYRVRKEQLDARRVLLATYVPASGRTVERREADLGSATNPPPSGLMYPVEARWAGSMIAPEYGLYRFHLESPGDTDLSIDGTSVSTAESPVVLGRGVHEVRLRGTLADDRARIVVRWGAVGTGLETIPRRFLWTGPGRGFSGEIRSLGKDPFGSQERETDVERKVIQRRIDGFLALRDSVGAVRGGAPFAGTWTGKLSIAEEGPYRFEVISNGGSTVTIDGELVVDNRHGSSTPLQAGGTRKLSAGTHELELRYVWTAGVGYLELYWEPPGGKRSILGPARVNTSGGVWLPDSSTFPVMSAGLLSARPDAPPPTPVASNPLGHPRGCALDASGNLYAADTERHRIAVFDAKGGLVRAWGREGRGPGAFVAAEDVAVADGRIYVLDSGLSRIQIFTPEGRLDGVWRDVGCSPAGFGVGFDGMVYVADTCGGGVRKYGKSGE
ncbi:MAG: PA14 domain-containing protein, partial [Acidobacteriota bacterium]|nr:PA14 domain-containing protein [Acidobacteriota bacterium]